MSRSYKKYNIIKDHPSGAKSMSKKRFRRLNKQILNVSLDDTLLKDEKSITNQYDVCDYIIHSDNPKYKRK